MFQGLVAQNPKVEKAVGEEITWARKALKKDDKITWYLRFIQIFLVFKLAGQNPEMLQQAENKLAKMAKKTAGLNPEQLKDAAMQAADPGFKHKIEHYLSLPVPEIQQYKYAWQTPNSVLLDFETSEEEWKENQHRNVDPDDEADVVIDFKDGFRWYNLNKAYCPNESRAMGHCGNSPRSHTSDRILSLRKDVDMGGGEIQHSPVLTFILTDSGELTEMKGRNNDKPVERYHKYIVPLLRHDIVKGIRGGGYLPEHNFSLDDLDPDVKDELLDEKPELAGPMEKIRELFRAGEYKQGLEAIEEIMDENGLSNDEFTVVGELTADSYQYADIRLSSYDSFEDFIDKVEDDTVQGLFKVRERVVDEMESSEEYFAKNENWYEDWMKENGYGQYINKKQFSLFKDEDVEVPSKSQVKAKIEEERGRDPWLKKIDAKLAEYASLGYSLENVYSIYLGPQKEKDPLGKWEASIRVGELMDIIEAMYDPDDDYDEHAYEADYWKSEIDFSWNLPISYDDMSYRREEEGLTTDTDPLETEVEEFLDSREEDDE